MTAAVAVEEQAPLYFVCYSRSQLDLAEKIEIKLSARRRRGELAVWRDKTNLEPGEEYTPEIMGVLQRAVGAVVVVSDTWYASEYIYNYEWPTILARKRADEHFQIFPLAYNLLDDDDSLGETFTFVNDPRQEPLVACSEAARDSVLTKLSNVIGAHARSLNAGRPEQPTVPEVPQTAPAPPQGAPALPDAWEGAAQPPLDSVPALPERFVEPAELDSLCARLRSGAVMGICGIHGEGGTGKSVIAAAIARRTAASFRDGVHWVTVGENASSEDVRRIQVDLLTTLGVTLPRPPRDYTQGTAMLAAALTDRSALIVVDDVWHPWQTRAFDIARGSTRVLFTTRFPESLPDGGAVTHISRLGTQEATAFLNELPAGIPATEEDLAAVLDAAGGLRLALAVLAATATVEGSWAPVLNRLDGLAERFGQGDDASSAQKALYVALQTLTPEDRDLALTLGAFPADTTIPIDLLGELWHISTAQASALADRLAARHIGTRAEDALTLHDHVHDFLVMQARTPSLDTHLRLWELAARRASGGWAAFAENSPYLWEYFVWHACRAGLNRAALTDVVSNLEWLTERIRRDGASAAEQDVGRVCEAMALAVAVPLSQLRRVLRHGSLFETDVVGTGLGDSLRIWADTVGLRRLGARRLLGGSLPVPGPELRSTLRGHRSECWDVAFTRTDRRLISCGEDRTTRIWDTRTGQPVLTLTDHPGRIWRLAVSHDERLLGTAGEDRAARIYDLRTDELVATLPGHDAEVWGFAFSPDDRRVTTASGDTVRIWDIEHVRMLRTMQDPDGELLAVAFSPDGRRVAAGGTPGVARVWSTDTGAELLTIRAHDATLRAVKFSPDGDRLLTSGDDSVARIWNAHNGAHISTLAGHSKGQVWDAEFSPDGLQVLTVSEDSTARLWTSDSSDRPLVLIGHTGGVHGAAFSPDGRSVATASGDSTARIWTVTTAAQQAPQSGLAGRVHDVAFSADQRSILAAVGDGTLRLSDIASGSATFVLSVGNTQVWGASFSPREDLVAGACEDGTVHVWNTGSRELRYSMRAHSKAWDTEFSPDGQYLATVGEDAVAHLWHADSGRRHATLTGHRGRIWEVGFSGDGQLVATGGDDGTTRIWDLAGTTEIKTLEGHDGSVWDVAFSSDDRLLATASEDGNARIWDVRTGALLHTLGEHAGQAWGIAFSSEDRFLASAGGNGSVRIWDCVTGECLLSLALGCSGPLAWRGEQLALAAGTHWAVIGLPGFTG
jgi:WD40 repeat protein